VREEDMLIPTEALRKAQAKGTWFKEPRDRYTAGHNVTLELRPNGKLYSQRDWYNWSKIGKASRDRSSKRAKLLSKNLQP